MRYLLGVDGGNTKTDYLLCREDGSFVDVYRTGSCSHESFDSGFDGMEKAMREQLDVVLKRNNINPQDISAGGFGLAGADMPSQIEELTRRIKGMGFTNFTVANDGILGVKAMSESGAGLCSVNGTGTVVIGIDTEGKMLQVGGVGEISGDHAGGGFVVRSVMHDLYAYYYRCGDNSSLFPQMLELIDVKPEDLIAIINSGGWRRNLSTTIIQMADREARNGDAVAQRIFKGMGREIGYSVSGCVRLLNFDSYGTSDNPLPVVLVGSVWLKVEYDGMKESLAETIKALTKKDAKLLPLDAPPAVGGALWARAMAGGGSGDVSACRKKLLENLTLEKYESLAMK